MPLPSRSFKDFVEQVHDIEADFKRSLFSELDSARQAEVKCLVGMILLRVGKAAAQSISVERIGRKSPIVPSVSDST